MTRSEVCRTFGLSTMNFGAMRFGAKSQFSFLGLEPGRFRAWRMEATSQPRAERGRPGSESAAEDALGARE